MPLLPTPYQLHDIDSVEDFCSAALNQQLRRWRATLQHADHEDALAYLIEETWRISTRYDPAITPSFAAYARPYQPRFLIQFYRTRFLDTRNEHRYTPDQWAAIKQLTFAGTLNHHTPNDEDDGTTQYPATPEHQQDQLDFTLRALSGDPSADCDPALARLLHRRDQPSDRLEARPDPGAHDTATHRAA